MECASCRSDIPALFGHAIRKNECPVCGQEIMDEESLILLDELRVSIGSAARLREDTIERIALALLMGYDIAPKSESVPAVARQRTRPTSAPDSPPPQQRVSARQQQPPQPVSRAQAAAAEEGISEEDVENGIMPVADLANPNLSDEERARIMEERVAARFNMTPSSHAATTPDALKARLQMGGGGAMKDLDLLNNPVLEAQRLARLQRQEANMAAGAGSVKRSEG